jgi:hypothetical protein
MLHAAVAIALVSLSLQAPTAWTRLDSVRMTGTERHFDGPANRISIARHGGQTMFISSGGLQGSLMGKERNEVSGSGGVFTWVTSLPGFSLWLPGPSTSHYASLLQPVRFSRKDIASNREAVEKALTGTFVRSSEAAWKGRDCFVLIVADKTAPSTHQEFWIDKETGLILKRRDWSGRTGHYELLIDRLTTSADLTRHTFPTPEKSVRVLGPVDPEILLRADGPGERQPGQEIAEVGARIGAPAWLRSINTPAGFRYIHTVSRKRASSRSAPLVGSSLGAPELMPGGLPSGWTVTGQIDPANGAIDMRFSAPDGSGPRAIIAGPRHGDDGSSFNITIAGGDKPPVSISFVAYLSPDGALVIAPGTSAREAEESRQAARRTIGAQGALVQSDFLDVKTGDTVSFMQSRMVDLKTRLRGFAAAEVSAAKVEGLGEVKRFEVRSPYVVRLVTWRAGDAEYLLSSCRLSFEELEKLAFNSSPVQRPM